MINLLMAALLGANLAGPPVPAPSADDEIICDTRQVPRRISKTHVVLDTQTRCYPAPDRFRDQLERVKLACEVLNQAYGEREGQKRCLDLIAKTGIELE